MVPEKPGWHIQTPVIAFVVKSIVSSAQKPFLFAVHLVLAPGAALGIVHDPPPKTASQRSVSIKNKNRAN